MLALVLSESNYTNVCPHMLKGCRMVFVFLNGVYIKNTNSTPLEVDFFSLVKCQNKF